MLSPEYSNPPHSGFFEPEGKSKCSSLGTLSILWSIQLGGHQLQDDRFIIFSCYSFVQGRSLCHLDKLSTELGLQLSSVTFHGVEGNTSLCLESSWIMLWTLRANRQLITGGKYRSNIFCPLRKCLREDTLIFQRLKEKRGHQSGRKMWDSFILHRNKW